MNGRTVIELFKAWVLQLVAAWDRFWFTPRYPHVLAILRIVTGGMLFYSHLVLATQPWRSCLDQQCHRRTAARWCVWCLGHGTQLSVASKQPVAAVVASWGDSVNHGGVCHWVYDTRDSAGGLVFANYVYPPFDGNPFWARSNRDVHGDVFDADSEWQLFQRRCMAPRTFFGAS